MNDTRAWLDRLLRATNEHDLEALTGCFAEDYENIAPVHPSRRFIGRDQVRSNWEQIFTFVPDLRAEVVAASFDGQTVWSQWTMRGTRRDGSTHDLAGVVVFDIDGDTAGTGTFFLEPVDSSEATVYDALREQVVR